ncbi:MAG: rod-binding protein [Magnetococcales bacterium]|nr:rod-binding protein [Magnetococcales bacterium]
MSSINNVNPTLMNTLSQTSTSPKAAKAGEEDLTTVRVRKGKISVEDQQALREKKLRDALSDFEAIFIKQMLGAMRKTVETPGKDDLFGQSSGEKMFREMLDGEYAKVMSQRQGGIGLKEALLDQMQRGRQNVVSSEQMRQETAESTAAALGAPKATDSK